MNLRLRLLIEWALIIMIGTISVTALAHWRGTTAFDNLLYDRLSALARPAPDENILLINIDEESLARIGKWPWDRSIHAALIAKLAESKPRTILYDILLSEPGDSRSDDELAQSITRAANVYLPVNFAVPGGGGRDFDVEYPIGKLAGAAQGIGHVEIDFDSDGIIRRVNLCVDDRTKKWPHLAELIVRNDKHPSNTFRHLQNCAQQLLLPYSPRDSHSEISFVEALEGRIPDNLVTGKDIIVGATAAGMGDNYAGPFGDGGVVSGTEIMANMIGALRRDEFVTPVPNWLAVLFALSPMWLLMFGFLRWQPRTALYMSLATVAIICLLSIVSLTARIWLPPGAAIAGVILVYPLWGWRRLQAISAFMHDELQELEHEGEFVPLTPLRDSTSDLVGRQSLALGRAIDHLRDLRRFVSDSLENLPDPMFVTNLSGKITMANRRLESYLNSEIESTDLATLLNHMVAPAHRRNVEDYLRQSAYGPDKAGSYVRFVSPQGSHFVMRSAPVVSDSGQVMGQIHYLADISALAQAESDREEALQLLSHDMRSPQSAIIALLPTIQDVNVRSRIEAHARRTIALSQDFVDVARMGESPLEGVDVLLADLARDIADNLWPLAHERGVSINVTDESESAFVLAEPDSLGRALTNLVDNAVKFSPAGGTIDISIAKKEVDGRSMVELRVRDEGPGIAPDLLPRLFTRFASHSAPDARIKSSGLGLTYVKAVAERHGGAVWAENQAKGACFQICLPEAEEPIPDPAG